MAKQPATPVPAATVLLVRDGSDGLEVFMVVRHHQIDFASGALVFPGGKIARGDSDPTLRLRCEGAEELDDTALGLRVAAIREVFEECGILLARPRGETRLLTGARIAALDALRGPLDKGEISMGEVAEREDLVLACDLLTPYAHWITPAMMPKRFDTHFYLAVAPADQVAVHDGAESVDSVWIRPQQAIEEGEVGTRTVIFPTLLNLRKLACSRTVAEAIAAARQGQIVTVEPWIEKRDSGDVLRIPAEAGYDITEQMLDQVRRA